MIVESLMLVLGVAAHFSKKMVEARAEDKSLHLVHYWTDAPYASSLSLISAVAGFFALQHYGELTVMTAFACGYMADSVAGALGERGRKW